MNIDKLVEANAQIADLKKQLSDLTLSKTFVSVSLTKLQVAHNKRVDEVLALKAQVEQLKLVALKYRRRDVHV